MQFYCTVLSYNRTCTYVNIGPNFCNRESNQIRIGPLQIKSQSRASFDWEGNNFRSNTSTFQRTSEMSTDLCTNPLKLTHSDINSSQILYRMYVLYVIQFPKSKKSFFSKSSLTIFIAPIFTKLENVTFKSLALLIWSTTWTEIVFKRIGYIWITVIRTYFSDWVENAKCTKYWMLRIM